MEDRRCTSEYVCLFSGATICWCSRKQDVVTMSLTEAKYIAAMGCACHCVWLKGLHEDLEEKPGGAINIMCDNSSTIKLSKNPVIHRRTKHIDVPIVEDEDEDDEEETQQPKRRRRYIARERHTANDLLVKRLTDVRRTKSEVYEGFSHVFCDESTQVKRLTDVRRTKSEVYEGVSHVFCDESTHVKRLTDVRRTKSEVYEGFSHVFCDESTQNKLTPIFWLPEKVYLLGESRNWLWRR
ncbi:putative RNA-directed DNA polymerase [Helianthus debilis subsp. tardiflorus]